MRPFTYVFTLACFVPTDFSTLSQNLRDFGKKKKQKKLLDVKYMFQNPVPFFGTSLIIKSI